MDIQGNNLLIEILKWIGVVFAAGFIGYFGRYLGMLTINRIQKPKAEPDKNTGFPAQPGEKTLIEPDDATNNIRLKIEKKRLKDEAKKAKKSNDQPERQLR